jgi:hypothetical protein
VTSFTVQLNAFKVKTERQLGDVFAGVTQECDKSVRTGSEITGSPGQPVGQYGPGYHAGKKGGFLRSSWIGRPLSRWSWVFETNAPYAESIEDGVSYAHGGTPMTLRSSVGGWHSVALTVAGFQRIVDVVTSRVVR